MKVAKLEGGWEGWAQVEIATIHGDAEKGFLRELSVFLTAKKSKVDFAFSWPLTFMELKCKTKSESGKQFAKRLVADVKKMEKTDPVYKMVVVGVVGLYPPKANGDHDAATELAIQAALNEPEVETFNDGFTQSRIKFVHTKGGHNIGICWWSGMMGMDLDESSLSKSRS